MPDKDFDNLFRDKFMDAEFEPSANLWSKIEGQLEPKRKRVFPIYWMAAASVAVVFTALMLFQKTEKIQLRPDEVTAAVMEKPASIITSPVTEEIEQVSLESSEASKTRIQVIRDVAQENNLVAVQPIEITDRLDIKRADPKPIDVLPAAQEENPIVIAQVTSQQKEETDINTEMDNIVERKGIRNVGDLVNYVVDKVDKRDKKLVRFNTDDDDNSSIIGINIGFLKFNKKK